MPCVLEQARDVDVLLYAAAAVRANAHHALPYEVAWIEKGPLAMGLYQVLFRAFGDGNVAAIAAAWVALALLGAALSWALASECGGSRGSGGVRLPGGAGPWAALLFAVSVGTVGGTLNTEIPAAVATAAAALVWLRGTRERKAGDSGWSGSSDRGRAAAGSSSAHPVNDASWRSALLAGVLAGVAFLCRQNGGALWPLLVLSEGLLVAAHRRTVRDALRSALAISAGFLGIAASVFVLYALRGTLAPMLFCFYGYNASIYIAATKVDAARLLSVPLVVAKNFLLPVWTTSILGLAGMGIAAFGLRKAMRRRGRESDRPDQGAPSGARTGRSSPERAAGEPLAGSLPVGTDAWDGTLPLSVIALVAIGLTASLLPGLRLFSHYFAMPLPFWAALGGVAIERLMGGPSEGAHRGAWRLRPRAVAVAAIVLVSLGAELANRPWRPAARVLREWVAAGGLSHPGDALVWPGHDPLSAKAARWLREHSAPDDTVFVWGMRPHVPIYAHRVPATRFVTCTFLTGLVPWERVGSEEDTSRWIVPGVWELLARDLDAERPRFIVDASQDHLFAMGAYPPSKYPPLQERLASRYEVVFDTGGEEHLVIWRLKDKSTSPVDP